MPENQEPDPDPIRADLHVVEAPDLSAALDGLEIGLLGAPPTLTRGEVAQAAGVPLEVAEQLWRLLGFARVDDDVVAFNLADVRALEHTHDLMTLGILSPDRQAALVRTWGRSYARLAEWQTTLLTDVALESADPIAQLGTLSAEVLPRVESLQNYVWRRHLFNASARMLTSDHPGAETSQLAVVFCDIVGFTSRSKELDEAELVGWIEYFEAETTGVVDGLGGRIIKNIGDEVLFVTEDVGAAAETALTLVARGDDVADDFPEVRAGLACGNVVSRLGDVFGPTVNIAARLTSIARPGTVLADQGTHDALKADDGGSPYRFKRVPRTSVKGYAHLPTWVLRRAGEPDPPVLDPSAQAPSRARGAGLDHLGRVRAKRGRST